MDRTPSRDSQPPAEGYRALVEHFPNGVLVLFDAELRYRIVGPETLPFSKRKAVDMVDRPIEELFPPETVERLQAELQATLDGEAHSFDMEYDGRIHHIETRPVDIDGERYGILVTQEVTAMRESERNLRKQNEHLDQFASMVSHDLRSPLSIAAGNLDLYRETGDDAALDNVEDALERIDELTQDLLMLVDAGESSADHEVVALADTARSAWAMIDTRSATLETTAGTITCDESQLQALFENLFRNAVGHGGADVTVRVGSLGKGFYVEDNGDGIPPDERDHVFDHGYSTGYGGSGVGLTIVKRITDAHGWEVNLRQSREGGARFEFRTKNSQ